MSPKIFTPAPPKFADDEATMRNEGAANVKKAANTHACAHRKRPRRNHTTTGTTNASEIETVLANIARPKLSNEPASQGHNGPERLAAGSSNRSSNRKKACKLTRHSRQLNMFFRSVIHATDSTCTGWTANTAAISGAPGTARRASKRHSSTALIPCNKTLCRW